jgi:carboxypeptidase family protein
MRQAIAFWIVLLATFPALGQTNHSGSEKSPVGSVQGNLSTTQDNEATGLAGITVQLSPEAPDGGAETADTDDTGHFDFDNLKPGSYSISISQQGFKKFSQAVSVIPGQAAILNIKLEIETVAEQVEVKEETQSIEAQAVSTPAETVTQNEMVALPTAQQKIREVLPVTPGVVKTQDGKLNFKGSDENQSLMLVNSARTADPVTGSFSIPVPTSAVQSFAVYKTPYNASLGSFTGGVTTVDTKPPEDEWNYRLKNMVPSVLGKNGSMIGVAEATPGFDFGGPLLNNKLLFSEVFQYEMKKTTVRGLPWPDDITKEQGFNSFTTLEAILSTKQVLTLTVNAFPLRQQHADINALVPQTASSDLDQNGIAVALSDKYQFDSGAILSAIAQFTRYDSNAHGQGLADMLVTPEGWGGNFFNQWARNGKEFQLIPAYQFAEKHWMGRHEIHVGVDFDRRSYAGASDSHPVQMLRQDGTLAEEISFLGVPLQNASDTAVAEFAQDHWVLNSHWAVDLGGRLSSEANGWSAAVAPRAGLAYSPGRYGKTVVRVGAGMFYSLLPLLAADFASNPTRVVSQYDLTGQPIGLPVTYANAYVGKVNPLTGAPLPQQPGTTPRNVTWNIGGDHQLRRNILVRLNYIDSHTTYLFVANPFTAAAGAQSFLGLSNSGSSHYREMESTVHFTVRGNNEVNASYIRSHTLGDLNNLSSIFVPFAQPEIRPNVYGILPYDVPNRVVTWGIFSLPRKFKFSPIVDAHSGYAYSNVDDQQNYVGTPNGQRFATYFALDVKFYREFRIPFLGSESGRSHHVRLGFYSLNVTNHGNFNAVYNNVTAPNFGQFVGFLDRRDGAVIDFVD